MIDNYDVGWICPNCKRNNITNPQMVDLDNTCEECGSEVQIELAYVVDSVTIVTKRNDHLELED